MDLDYIQKNIFQEGGGCGIPFITNDSSILTTSLSSQMGGNALHLVIPGGLTYCPYEIINTNIDIDPWKVNIKEDFNSLLDLVSIRPTKKNKTEKKRLKK